jgi:hypothetical protein|tara:strand:+ start:172 stop:366 length:195 start_codon:yes stop_codon:yes gene_type:complete
MKKFNQWESHIIVEALTQHIKACENEVAEAESAGKRSIFAKGFFEMQIGELIGKVTSEMTRKNR